MHEHEVEALKQIAQRHLILAGISEDTETVLHSLKVAEAAIKLKNMLKEKENAVCD